MVGMKIFYKHDNAWSRKTTSECPFVSDNPFMVELKRPAGLADDIAHGLKVLVDDTVCVAYLDSRVAMSARIYNFSRGRWDLLVQEGK